MLLARLIRLRGYNAIECSESEASHQLHMMIALETENACELVCSLVYNRADKYLVARSPGDTLSTLDYLSLGSQF